MSRRRERRLQEERATTRALVRSGYLTVEHPAGAAFLRWLLRQEACSQAVLWALAGLRRSSMEDLVAELADEAARKNQVPSLSGLYSKAPGGWLVWLDRELALDREEPSRGPSWTPVAERIIAGLPRAIRAQRAFERRRAKKAGRR